MPFPLDSEAACVLCATLFLKGVVMKQRCPCPQAVVSLGWTPCGYSACQADPPNSSPLLYSGPLNGKFLHFNSSFLFSSRIPFKSHWRIYTGYFWVGTWGILVCSLDIYLLWLKLLQRSSVIFIKTTKLLFFLTKCPSGHLLREALPSGEWGSCLLCPRARHGSASQLLGFIFEMSVSSSRLWTPSGQETIFVVSLALDIAPGPLRSSLSTCCCCEFTT